MHIAVWHNLGAGGAKRLLEQQVAGLVRRGHTVTSWCPPGADAVYLPLSSYGEVREVAWPQPAFSEATKLHRLATVYRRQTARLAAEAEHAMEVARQIASSDCDLLFCAGCRITSVPSLGGLVDLPGVLFLQEPRREFYEALPGWGWPWTTTRHEDQTKSPTLSEQLAEWLHLAGMRARCRAEARNLAAFDHVLVNSIFSRENVYRAFARDASVCYWGIDVNRFCDHGREREPFAMAVGSLGPHKNPGFLVESLALLPAPRPPLVWIAPQGSDEAASALQDLALRRGVDLTVKRGVSDEELVETYNRARLFLFAPRLEPFGLVPLEAGACGVPVVGIREGGLRETILDGVTGRLTDPDPQAFADAVGALWSDPDTCRKRGQAGREQVVRHWSLDAAEERLEAILQAAAIPGGEP